MKFFKKKIHQVIAYLTLEDIIVTLAPSIPFFNKFIPPHSVYREGTFRPAIRHGVMFMLDISDYMQWCLYANQVDPSWEIAINNVTPNSIILDVGSNVGGFSLKLAKALASKGINDIDIYAFEPNPSIFDLLKKNISLNLKFSSVILAYPQALGAKNSRSAFVFGGRNSGAGRLSDSHGEIVVDVMTLSSFADIQDFKKRISFIKIDVESFEPEVLEGAWSLIKKDRPVIYFEYSPTWCAERGVNAFEMIESLEAIKYDLVYEEGSRMLPVRKNVEALKLIYQTNILAIPLQD